RSQKSKSASPSLTATPLLAYPSQSPWVKSVRGKGKSAPQAICATKPLKTVNARVITIDGNKLVELMIESGIGIRVRKVFELHRIDEDFFLDD
ncbi:MAG: hypothetical protein AB3N13_04805, partial [Arenibacterium sp.]